ncbi:MAG: Crp/Fnr family transcriptional regulator [Cyclobacteriaceae bacterium]|nr:Crp/Fnr family transcriptional regulator [Cyclobacteriaceae bacterium]
MNLLTHEELKILNRNRYSVRFKPNELILKQGLPATHVISLIHGIAKMYIEGLHNKNLLFRLAGSWQLINVGNASTGELNQFSVTALTEVQVCFIEAANFQRVLESNGKFACEVIKHRNQHTIFIFKKIISLTQKHMLGRMADGLLYLTDDFYHTPSFVMNLSRQDLADLTAMSKDSAIRILKDFEKDRILSLRGKHMEILNKDALIELSTHG